MYEIAFGPHNFFLTKPQPKKRNTYKHRVPAVVRYLWCTRIKYTRIFGGFLKKMFSLKTNSTDAKRGRTNVLYVLSFTLVFSRCIVLQTSVSTNNPGSKAYVLVRNGIWHTNVHYWMVGIIVLSKSRRVMRLN